MRKEFLHVKNLIQRRPELISVEPSVREAFLRVEECYQNGGKVLICGNGGSAADSSHIAGELMKSFMKKRSIPAETARKLALLDMERGKSLAETLQGGLAAIALSADSSVTVLYPMIWGKVSSLPSRY